MSATHAGFARCVAIAWILALGALPAAAQKWQLQYFYDKDKSTFAIADLWFSSTAKGVAAGVVQKDGSHAEPMLLVTSDGGAHWDQQQFRETPRSLFFLNEDQGWMVTGKGLWQTADAGRNWTKVGKLPGQVLRVYFADRNNGWAVGTRKSALETHDGGQKWTPIAAAASQPGEPANSAYTWITFATPQYGLMTGWNIPPKRSAPPLPSWADPEGTLRIRETPHLSYTLVTRDGGKTWKPDSASLLGTVMRIRLNPNGKAIGLVSYGQSFQYPSEAYSVDWITGKSHTIYRDARFDITDVWLASDGTAYLAGTLIQGRMRGLLPGKVLVFRSTNYETWTPMQVDYRAEAVSAVFAAAGDRNLWLATDTGMILKLVQ